MILTEHGTETLEVLPYPLCHFFPKRFKDITANLNDIFSKMWEVRETAGNPENHRIYMSWGWCRGRCVVVLDEDSFIPETRTNGLAGSKTPGRCAGLARALQRVTAWAQSACHSSVSASVEFFESKSNTRVVRVEEMSHLLGGVFLTHRIFTLWNFIFVILRQ